MVQAFYVVNMTDHDLFSLQFKKTLLSTVKFLKVYWFLGGNPAYFDKDELFMHQLIGVINFAVMESIFNSYVCIRLS